MTVSTKHELLDKLVRHALELEMRKLLPRIDHVAKDIGVEPAVLKQYLKLFLQEVLDLYLKVLQIWTRRVHIYSSLSASRARFVLEIISLITRSCLAGLPRTSVSRSRLNIEGKFFTPL